MLTVPMSVHIIIDGYNLIRRSARLSLLDRQDIEQGREALVDMLAAYKKFKAHRITVVFDGARAVPFSPQRNRHKGISIQFSRGKESADDVIIKMARKEGPKALVVSSDRQIVHAASAAGAATISSAEFEDKLAMAAFTDGMDADRDAYEGWKPTTRKKGPGRRLPKRQRRNRARLRKL